MKKIKRLLTSEKGFTLIELMVVVVILGVLAAIAVPQFTGRADTAKVNKAKADLKIMANAVDLYFADEGEYPAQLSDLVNGGYLKDVPTPPTSGEEYDYLSDSDEYYIYCAGVNKNYIIIDQSHSKAYEGSTQPSLTS